MFHRKKYIQICPQYITRHKTSVISNKVAVKFISVYFLTFLLMIAIVFSKGNISGFSWLSLAHDFSVRLFPPPRALEFRHSINFSPFLIDAPVARVALFSLALARAVDTAIYDPSSEETSRTLITTTL